YLMFYLVQNDTVESFLSNSEQPPKVFFSMMGANSDSVNHVRDKVGERGELEVAFEDLFGGGDNDFNDVVFTVSDTHLIVPGIPGEMVNATVSIEGKEALYNSEIGLLLLDDATGKIGNLLPGDAGYAEALMRISRVQTIFSPTPEFGTNNTVAVTAGKYMVVYAIVDGTKEQWLANNPSNSSSVRPYALFSHVGANPDGINHFNRLLGDELVLEDLWGGGDRDFNDLRLKIRFE
ncbi:MAG: DUF4114 domain-containing protein, partial [Xenococcaceae cyanobacterium]